MVILKVLMGIGLGCDNFGLPLKEILREFLLDRGERVEDFGTHSEDLIDYPDVAFQVAEAVQDGSIKHGILVCRTGIGMAIAANKALGVYAACVSETCSALAAKQSNNVQIIALGSQLVTPMLACEIVEKWLDAEFKGGDSQRKLDKIRTYEKLGVWSLK